MLITHNRIHESVSQQDGVMPKTVVVAGAGVVGLSVARAVARRAGMEVVVLEANMRVGMETSARNSEVIHGVCELCLPARKAANVAVSRTILAGIYYPKNSLKARLCVRGRDLLYDYCETHSVSHKRCGKLIVAQAHQVSR
jgi:L-2-hydroxyglutarate oxidase LhgO